MLNSQTWLSTVTEMVVAVTNQKAVPSIEFSTTEGNFEPTKEVEDTVLDLLRPFTEGSGERDASSSIIMTLLIAQTRTEWQKEPSAE